ncbi:hypothetical protein [Burkholderia pseudomallei]|uniref:hypothetical protein n=1 Tax=Burkholderia pseudomallei TaxID=28450 RepID=UPI003C2D5AFB
MTTPKPSATSRSTSARACRAQPQQRVLERVHVVADAVDPDLDAVGALELDRRILGQRAGLNAER